MYVCVWNVHCYIIIIMKFGYKLRCHWLKEGVLPEYNHGAELKLSRYLPIFTTSRVSPTLLSSFNRLTALKKRTEHSQGSLFVDYDYDYDYYMHLLKSCRKMANKQGII